MSSLQSLDKYSITKPIAPSTPSKAKVSLPFVPPCPDLIPLETMIPLNKTKNKGLFPFVYLYRYVIDIHVQTLTSVFLYRENKVFPDTFHF